MNLEQKRRFFSCCILLKIFSPKLIENHDAETSKQGNWAQRDREERTATCSQGLEKIKKEKEKKIKSKAYVAIK